MMRRIVNYSSLIAAAGCILPSFARAAGSRVWSDLPDNEMDLAIQSLAPTCEATAIAALGRSHAVRQKEESDQHLITSGMPRRDGLRSSPQRHGGGVEARRQDGRIAANHTTPAGARTASYLAATMARRFALPSQSTAAIAGRSGSSQRLRASGARMLRPDGGGCGNRFESVNHLTA